MATSEELEDLVLLNVIKFLKKHSFSSARASNLGIALGVSESVISGIEYGNPKNVDKVLMEVIGHWLANDTKKSWAKLAEALDFCTYGNAAQELRGILGIEGSVPVNKQRPEFNMASLGMLKIKRDGGQVENYYLLQEICMSWNTIGSLIGLGTGRLDTIETTNMRNPMKCVNEVFSDWIRIGKGKGNYEPNWDGLIELLNDIELSSAAIKLEEILKQ